MKTLIQGGTIVSDMGMCEQDILLEDGKVSCLGTQLDRQYPDAERVDATGKLIFPGFIDAHTHMDLPVCGTVTADDFSSGTEAAVCGGTTCIVDFATQDFGETLHDGLRYWQKKAEGKSSCDYAFHMAISEWRPDIREELPSMFEEGITSFKLYMTYGNRVSDEEIFEILTELKKLGGLVGVHCENNEMIEEGIARMKKSGVTAPCGHPKAHPDESEAEAIRRLLAIAARVDVPVIIVHLSTRKGLEEVREARKRGQKVYVESCPQYLLLDDSRYSLPEFEGAKYICSPPLRKKEDQDALWQALEQGELQTIATDHCSFTMQQKKAGDRDFSKTPGGMPGVEERAKLLYTYGVGTGRISLPEMVRYLSTNPAKLYGMYPKKGALHPGSDADLVIWNPEKNGVITAADSHSACGYAPYEGWKITGMPEQVYVRGIQVVEQGKLIARNCGSYVFREKGNL